MQDMYPQRSFIYRTIQCILRIRKLIRDVTADQKRYKQNVKLCACVRQPYRYKHTECQPSYLLRRREKEDEILFCTIHLAPLQHIKTVTSSTGYTVRSFIDSFIIAYFGIIYFRRYFIKIHIAIAIVHFPSYVFVYSILRHCKMYIKPILSYSLKVTL